MKTYLSQLLTAGLVALSLCALFPGCNDESRLSGPNNVNDQLEVKANP